MPRADGDMVFLALNLIGCAIGGASVERAAMKAPKTRASTPKELPQTASWLLHYTNRARERHKLSPLRRYRAGPRIRRPEAQQPDGSQPAVFP